LNLKLLKILQWYDLKHEEEFILTHRLFNSYIGLSDGIMDF